jgi:hypothetical protein
MYLLLMQPPTGVDPGEGNEKQEQPAASRRDLQLIIWFEICPIPPTQPPLLSFAVVFLLRKGRHRVGSTPERSERGRAHHRPHGSIYFMAICQSN